MGWNQLKMEERRFFSVASLGRSRWYWIVWPSLEELKSSQEPLLFIAEGLERTRSKAVENAQALAGASAARVAAKYAKKVRHQKIVMTRKYNQPEAAEYYESPRAMEFLYRDVYDAQNRDWKPVSHRVTAKTRKYVYVERSPYSPNGLSGIWLDHEQTTYRLDRQTLERQGFTPLPTEARAVENEEPVFFNYERMKSREVQLYKCLEALRLSWPCTVADVRKAYRKLARQAHPDGGGSEDKFLALQEAYHLALQFCD